jgi:integrase
MPDTSVGLRRAEAEGELRRRLVQAGAAGPGRELLDLPEAGKRYVHHVEHFRGRKRSTVQDYQIILERHLVPFFGDRSLDSINRRSIEAYQQIKLTEGLAPKTVANHVRFLHGIYRHAVGREWAARNPVTGIEHPRKSYGTAEVRALLVKELEALLRAVPGDYLGATDQALYLTAAMTGLRRGELLALRWADVDQVARVVRVQRSYGRGEFTTPKSLRSVRAVPLADRVAETLGRHHGNTRFRKDDDLVFCHPRTGRPYDDSRMRKRFKEALGAAGLRDTRFHDLRHTFGTRMAAAGAPLRFIQEWLGHRDYRTTSIYAGYAADPSAGAAYARQAFPSPKPCPRDGPSSARPEAIAPPSDSFR